MERLLQCHAKVDDFLIGELGFQTSRSDPCLYIKRVGNTILLIALYVDDLLLAGSDIDAITWMKGELNKRFKMKDLGEAKVCIVLEIPRDRATKRLSLTQSKYASNVLERFRLSACNPAITPMEQVRKVTISDSSDAETNAPYRLAVGCLMYLMVGTRPDSAYAIGKLLQQNADPHESDWVAVKRVMRYLRGTQNLGIVFNNSSAPPSFLAIAMQTGPGVMNLASPRVDMFLNFVGAPSVGARGSKLSSQPRLVKQSTLH